MTAEAIAALGELIGETPWSALFSEKRLAKSRAVRDALADKTGYQLDDERFVALTIYARQRLRDEWREAPRVVLQENSVARALCYSMALRLHEDDNVSLVKRKIKAADFAGREEDIFRDRSSGTGLREISAAYLEFLTHLIRKDAHQLGWTTPAFDELMRRSDRYIGDVIHAGGMTTQAEALDGYIERDVQPMALRAIRDAKQSEPIVIHGDAGTGKSTLLVWLARELQGLSFVVSAAWFLDPHPEIGLRATTILDAVGGSRPTILIDTADLLLRTERDAELLHVTVEKLIAGGCRLVMTTRPREMDLLRQKDFRLVELRDYSDAESDRAVRHLARKYCPEIAGDDAVARLHDAAQRGVMAPKIRVNPLLLRLLFQVTAPDFPNLDVDTTGLYERLWEHRVKRDDRSVIDGRELTQPRIDTDLTSVASRLALFMMAHSELHQPKRGAGEYLAEVEFPRVDTVDVDYGIGQLERRAVLEPFTGGTVRFFHQTVFEFAVGKAMAARGAGREFDRLLQYLLREPDDLFVAAIMERFVAVAVTAIGAARLERGTRQMLASSHPNLRDLAVRVFAIAPEVVGLIVDDLNLLSIGIDDPALQKMCDDICSYKRRDPSAALNVLATLAAAKGTQAAALKAITFMCGQHAEEVANRLTDAAIDELLAVNAQLPQSQSQECVHLAEAFVAVRPDRTREFTLRCIEEISKHSRSNKSKLPYLQLLADRWPQLESDGVLNQLTEHFRRPKICKAESASVRPVLGKVIAAQLTFAQQDGQAFLEYVDGVCDELEASPDEIWTVARLFGVCQRLSEDGVPTAIEAAVLARLFALKTQNAARALQSGPLALILASDCRTRSALIAALGHRLRRIELKPEPASRVATDRVWAEVARETLDHPSIPDEVFAEVIQRAQLGDSADPWLDDDRMVKHCARAALLNIGGAAWALEQIAAAGSKYFPKGGGVFVDGAKPYVTGSSLLLAAFMRMVAVLSRPATINDVLQKKPTQLVPADLRGFESELREIVKRSLRLDKDRADAACKLWQAMATEGVLSAEFVDIDYALLIVKHTSARALLLNLWSERRADSSASVSDLAYYRANPAHLDTSTGIVTSATGMAVGPAEAEALRSAWLTEIAQRVPTPAEVPRVVGLALGDRQKVARFVGRDLRTAIYGLADSGEVDAAIALLLDVCRPFWRIFSDKQVRKLTNTLPVAIQRIAEAADDRQVGIVVRSVPEVGDRMGAIIVGRFAKRHMKTMDAVIDDQLLTEFGDLSRKEVLTARREHTVVRPGTRLEFILRAAGAPAVGG